MSDRVVGFGCPYDKEKTESFFATAGRIAKVCRNVKRNGPASLDLCYVASGRLDAYFETDLKKLDYAAGELIVKEADEKVTNWLYTDPHGMTEIIASNGKVHTDVISCILWEKQGSADCSD